MWNFVGSTNTKFPSLKIDRMYRIYQLIDSTDEERWQHIDLFAEYVPV